MSSFTEVYPSKISCGILEIKGLNKDKGAIISELCKEIYLNNYNWPAIIIYSDEDYPIKILEYIFG